MADTESFRGFFEAQIGPLRALAFRLTGDWAEADDLAQEALVRTYRSWNRIRERERPELYARATLINRHRSLLRRTLVEARHIVSRSSDDRVEQAFDADAAVIRQELLRLPARQRAALVLYFYEDMPQSEIALVLGCAVGTVQSLVHRGLERLRARIAGDPAIVRSEA